MTANLLLNHSSYNFCIKKLFLFCFILSMITTGRAENGSPVEFSLKDYWSVSVAGSSTSLVSDVNPSCFGSSITLTATVTPNDATGNVEFFDGATSLGISPVVSGAATLSLSSLGAGPHSLTAVYYGDINYSSSTSPVLTQSVDAAIPTTPLNINGIVTQCPSLVEQIYSISPVANATIYNWTVPSGWAITGGTGTEIISVSTGLAGQNGDISVGASNSCGTSAVKKLSVTVISTPATPGAISGNATVCSGSTNTYNISTVTNATTYTWVVPASWVINSGQGSISINVTAGNSGGNITVTAGNSCGNSTAQTKNIVVNSKPVTPGTISGPTAVCPSATGLVYNIAAVPNTVSYTWTLPAGWTATPPSSTTSITVTSGGSGGNIMVAAVNGCGSSDASQTFNINPLNATDNTGYATSSTKFSDGIFVANNTAPIRRGYLKFPLNALIGMPLGATVTSTLKLTNNASTVSTGNFVNALGANDPVSSSAATLFAAAATGANYSTANWPGAGLVTLPLSNQANLDIASSISSPGYIAMGLVRPATGSAVANFWGYSAGVNAPLLIVSYASVSSLAVTVSPGTPAPPGTITGPAIVCPNSSGNGYNIIAVPNATTYTWSVPAGWSITSGQGTTAIVVTATLTGGNISVKAGNTCGTSAAGTPLSVSISALPTVTASPTAEEKCSAIAIDPITASSPTGTSFIWTRDNTIAVTGMAASGTGSPITGTLINNTGTQQTTTFLISAVNAAGCISASPASVPVKINPNPIANAGPDLGGCAATAVAIGGSPTASGGTPGYTYLWTPAAGISDATIANPTAVPGTYTVTVTDTKGCKSADAVTVNNSSGNKTWVGLGVVGGTGPDNNFNNPLNWNPVGIPGPCNDVFINVDIYNIFNVLGGSLIIPLSSNITIKSLSIDIGGTVAISSATFFKLDVASNSLNILTTTNLNTHTSTFFAPPVGGYIAVGPNGIVTYGSTLTTLTSNNCLNFPLYANSNNTGKIYVNGNASLAGIGNDPSNKPARIIFDGTGTQTITNSSGTQSIFLGATSTDIGETNSPTVVLAGAGSNGFKAIGDLNVNNTSTLDIGSTQTLNRNSAGGTINLAAGTFLKVGKNTGGFATSNFPINFTSYNFNPTSTVEYNGALSQSISTAPLYGNLTLSNANNKQIATNLNVQKNIAIQGTAIFVPGANTITLGGNWTNYAQGGFNEQTSTVDFNSAGPQSINTTGGEIFYGLKKSGLGTTTMLSDVAVQGGASAFFNLSNGVFDAGTFSFNSASGGLFISNGLLKLARTGATFLPEFAVNPYNLTGGTIELYGAGDQVLRGSRDYRNLTFSTSGIKTISSGITSIIGTILTQNSVTLDVANHQMGGTNTNLTMTGSSLYKTAGTGPGSKPDAQGTYTLGVGTTVEFTNTAASTEDIRLTLPTYYNVVVSGTSVANTSAGTGIKFQPGGTFTVKNGGLFKLANSAGFSGGTTTSVDNTNNPAIVLEDGSTVEYYGGPAGTNLQLITNGIPYHSLNFSGTSIKTAPAGTITVRGNLSNVGSGFAHNNGIVLMSGTTAQNYNSTGTILNYYDFTISNPINVNINNNLNIENQLSLSAAGKLNLVAGNIALRSGPLKTASVDKINVDNSISYGTGRFIVERFIPTGSSHGKTWQFLSTPAFGQSVNSTWQEGNAPLVIGTPGLGTTISSERPGAVARGFDFYTPAGPSIKTYKALSNSWVGIDDGAMLTNALPLANNKGYMLFVRGDRQIQNSSAAANATTIRTTGKLFSPGLDAPPSTSVLPNLLESVGNPYAAPIDFTKLVATSSGIDSKFYVWDPLLPGSSGFGYGGYQLLSSVNSWNPIPGGTSNYSTGTAYSKIQSGQAFFIYSTPGGTVNFDESNKLAGSQMVYRGDPNPQRQFLRTYLYGINGFIADGNVVAFDPAFTNAFDANDAIKIDNSTENFGIGNNNKTLALDARPPIIATDTVFYTFNNLQVQSYQLKIVPDRMHIPGAAYLVDKFSNTHTPLSLTDSNKIVFNITSDPASALPDRFYIIFKVDAPLPLSIVRLSAKRNTDEKVSLNWQVDNEINMQEYNLERSVDGKYFDKIKTVVPVLNNGSAVSYAYMDEQPYKTDNFYRITAKGIDGLWQYSNIVTVPGLKQLSDIKIYPNPVTDHIIHIFFDTEQEGEYQLQVYNKSGQLLQTGKTSVGNTSTNYAMKISKYISAGNYRMVVTAPDNRKWDFQVLIK